MNNNLTVELEFEQKKWGVKKWGVTFSTSHPLSYAPTCMNPHSYTFSWTHTPANIKMCPCACFPVLSYLADSVKPVQPELQIGRKKIS